MLLAATTDKIQMVTSAAVTVDVHVTYMDLLAGVVTPGRQNTAISTATTTDIVASPAGSTYRTVVELTARNKSAATSVDVTVVFDQNGTDYELVKVTLLAGQTLEYKEGIGFYVVAASTSVLTNKSTAAQGAGFSSDTYLTGSNVPCVNPVIGTLYRLTFDLVKTAAGTAAPVITVRVGTAATTADTSRLAFTFGSGTGAADTGRFEVEAMFRAVGSGTSAVLQGRASLISNLTTTGISNAVKVLQVTSGGFDSTVASTQIGASYNGGTSASHTVQLVTAKLEQF